jgi:hypothetical protein
MNNPTQAIIPQVKEALAAYDAKSATCPFNKRPPPPTEKPCPKCAATADEGCQVDAAAAFGFVTTIRALVQGRV